MHCINVGKVRILTSSAKYIPVELGVIIIIDLYIDLQLPQHVKLLSVLVLDMFDSSWYFLRFTCFTTNHTGFIKRAKITEEMFWDSVKPV